MLAVYDLTLWEAFVTVAKLKSFSQAARELRISPPQLSKRVSRLEDLLSVRLLHRSTRSLSLTHEGEALLPVVIPLLQDFADIESKFGSKDEVQGVVRVTCVPAVAERFVVPKLKNFQKRYPKVQVSFVMSQRITNLIEENIDVALRIQTPTDTSLVYRKLAENKIILAASPKYLKRSKVPLRSPKDLHKHPFLTLSIHDKIPFEDSKITLGDFRDNRQIHCEDGVMSRELAVSGFGVIARSSWDLQPLLDSGKLVPVLEKYPLKKFGDLYAVVPTRRYLAPRVRAFLDFFSVSC